MNNKFYGKNQPVNPQIFRNKRDHVILVNEHTLLRWNERVKAPIFKTVEELNSYLQNLYVNSRIEHIIGNNYFIDNDLVCALKFTVVAGSVKVQVSTVYGKCSINHFLYNFEYIFKNRMKHGDISLAV